MNVRDLVHKYSKQNYNKIDSLNLITKLINGKNNEK